ncbi:uncharacterized protein TM35_000084350 [Trypanosoma theileri]|uniref:Mucin-associated surface protein (MASP) n=1 Tax=Trypanosoma theileri TaxID=67003 RepID=A0A1X0P131_9TRYP|nr:uncharacterized protein TM35_000084350 [Trypanosoma theileri]ORC90637.1 hypothetical protein TM35_000084350 [Trypanosoma theileri]
MPVMMMMMMRVMCVLAVVLCCACGYTTTAAAAAITTDFDYDRFVYRGPVEVICKTGGDLSFRSSEEVDPNVCKTDNNHSVCVKYRGLCAIDTKKTTGTAEEPSTRVPRHVNITGGEECLENNDDEEELEVPRLKTANVPTSPKSPKQMKWICRLETPLVLPGKETEHAEEVSQGEAHHEGNGADATVAGQTNDQTSHKLSDNNNNHGETTSNAAHNSAHGTFSHSNTTTPNTGDGAATTQVATTLNTVSSNSQVSTNKNGRGDSTEQTSVANTNTHDRTDNTASTSSLTADEKTISIIISASQQTGNADSSVSPVWMRTAAPLLIVAVLFSATVY